MVVNDPGLSLSGDVVGVVVTSSVRVRCAREVSAREREEGKIPWGKRARERTTSLVHA